MMEGGFKHITVTSDTDQDVVIYAGMRPDQAGGDEPSREGVGAPGQARSGKPAASPADEACAPQLSEQEEPAPSDELEGAPMPLKQRIIIAIAVVCLIGAVAYCLTLMR